MKGALGRGLGGSEADTQSPPPCERAWAAKEEEEKEQEREYGNLEV